ncbi:MAG: hypothetical protein M3O09_00820 [Acidobacteriota bacterium]|nr:hypothetical protein [Acidobacteriota bacterium]
MVGLEAEFASRFYAALHSLGRVHTVRSERISLEKASRQVMITHHAAASAHYFMAVSIISLVFAGPARAVQLEKETLSAFNTYVSESEKQMPEELTPEQFLSAAASGPQARAAANAKLANGEVLTRRVEPLIIKGKSLSCPGGIIHHWAGIVFIPGVSLARTIAFLQDYDHESRFYSPDVQRSKLLKRDGDSFTVSLRLKRTKVLTVLLDADFAVEYKFHDPTHATSRSRSLAIREVENAGTVNERDLPDGQGHGFLWRLNSYWRFQQADGGTYVQLEAISLTRDIPPGLGWIVNPFVTTIPRDSLLFTLGRTRDALSKEWK